MCAMRTLQPRQGVSTESRSKIGENLGFDDHAVDRLVNEGQASDGLTFQAQGIEDRKDRCDEIQGFRRSAFCCGENREVQRCQGRVKSVAVRN